MWTQDLLKFFISIHWKDLETITNAVVMSTLREKIVKDLNIISQEPGVLGEMANSRSGAKKCTRWTWNILPF